MSLALYRKYRPGSFAEVVGQEHVTDPLQQAIRNGRVHHAYLFSGPRGCGKTTCARVLARSLNCAAGPTPEPCGSCDSCVALAPNGPGSIDVIEIDAASHGGVDDARELRERAFFAPVSSRFKVYVIDEAHMVSKDGFNALLKLVEEPPEHVKLIFCTTEPEKVIGTIRSRTHHYPFRLIAPQVLRSMLAGMCEQEGIEVEPAVLPLVVRAGAGSARDALSVLDQLLAGAGAGGVSYKQAVALLGYTDENLLDQVVDALSASDGATVFETVDQVISSGNDPRRFAADLLQRLRDLVVLAAVPDVEHKGLLDAPPDQLERMRGQADRGGAAALTRAADIVSAALTEMRGATSPRLLLELMCARLLLPEAVGGEAALAARLDRMERRLRLVSASSTDAPPPAATAPAPQPAAKPAASAPPAATTTTPAAAAPAPRPEVEPATPTAAAPALQTEAEPATPVAPAPPAEPTPAATTAPTPAAEPTRPAEPTPAAATEPIPPAPSQPAEPAPATPARGLTDVSELRRMWPEVLEAVKARRKFAWMVIKDNAQVASADGNVLKLAFSREGDAKGFANNGCEPVLREALAEVLGMDWRIETTTGAGQPPPAAAVGAPAQVSGPSAPAEAPEPDLPEPVDDAVDDPSELDAAQPADDGLTGLPLLERELGARVIDEPPDSPTG
ncbi:MAG: DNA polymerase III subunit gamma and tau [Streptosporangiales bacterium]|nr:DNA polymerase III subunit gamma and tau [Streptosporangiales bacterium]